MVAPPEGSSAPGPQDSAPEGPATDVTAVGKVNTEGNHRTQVLHPRLNIGSLRAIYARNLHVSNSERALLRPCYELTARNEYTGEFEEIHRSEVVVNSLNPTWRPLCEGSLHRLSVFVRSSSQVHVHVYDDCADESQGTVIDRDVDFRELTPCTSQLRSLEALPSNTLVFDFDHGLYTQRGSSTTSSQPASTLSDTRAPTGRHQASAAFYLPLVRHASQRIRDVSTEVKVLTQKVEERLASRRLGIPQAEKRQQAKSRLDELRECIIARKAELSSMQGLAEQNRADLLPRSKRLVDAQEALAEKRRELEENQEKSLSSKSKLSQVVQLVRIRRQQLVSQLGEVFPIEAMTQATPKGKARGSEKYLRGRHTNKILTICGIPLPNSEFNPRDKEHISTALGYVAHLVLQLAKYYNVPLRYNILFNSSFTEMRDDVYQHPRSNIFPLYAPEQKVQFEYAVFMLNKNVEQVINSQGLFVVSLRHTLPNLKSLLSQSVSAASGSPTPTPPPASPAPSSKRSDVVASPGAGRDAASSNAQSEASTTEQDGSERTPKPS